ncbi:MAG: hypothetical protein IPM69_10455 [Ignavibacteria bacterium]|nr:hypothetical protein [Ignavibacteria bacterium]
MLRKPHQICRVSPELEHIQAIEDIREFVKNEKAEIEQTINNIGLTLRRAELKDFSGIRQLLCKRFNPDTAAQISFYDAYRSIRHGYTMVLEDKDGQIVGYDYSLGYDDDDKTSFGLNIAIHPDWAGYKLKTIVSIYTSLLGMERGSRIRRGIVHPNNLISLHNLLNNTGFLCEHFYGYLPGFESSRFILSFSLTPAGLMNNRIDMDKLLDYINVAKEGEDYKLVECDDEPALEEMYNSTTFRVVAFVREGALTEKNLLFAVPHELMNFPPSSIYQAPIG